MDFDQILQQIGEFGRFQKRNYLLICLPVLFAAANSLSYVFTAGIPQYRCFVPECEEYIGASLDEPWLSNALPGTTSTNGVFTPSQCQRYLATKNETLNTANDEYCPINKFPHKVVRCNDWVFDMSEITIVQEWLITCFDNQWKLAFVGTIHFAGLIIGTASFGFLADKFGRKIIFLFCSTFMAITGILQGLAWNYESFIVFALLNAIGTSGVYPLAFILGVEMVGPKKREMAGVILNYFYAVGEALVGLVAYVSKDWRIIQYILSCPPVLFIGYYWILPESVRWLLNEHEYEKAALIIRNAAQVNCKPIEETKLTSLEEKGSKTSNTTDEGKGKVYSIEDPNQEKAIKKSQVLRTLKEVMQSKILLGRFSVLIYIWMANAFVYYGLSLNSTFLSGNKYINFALVCLVEIPGYTLSWVAMNKIGRRWSMSISLLLCSLTCVAGGFISDDAENLNLTWVVITLFLIGKLGITCSFTIAFVLTAEVMPTAIRSGGVGFMSTLGRFGAMIASFVPLLGDLYKPLPLVLFGAVSFIGTVLSPVLPETFHKKLPDTVEESERLGQKIDVED